MLIWVYRSVISLEILFKSSNINSNYDFNYHIFHYLRDRFQGEICFVSSLKLNCTTTLLSHPSWENFSYEHIWASLWIATVDYSRVQVSALPLHRIYPFLLSPNNLIKSVGTATAAPSCCPQLSQAPPLRGCPSWSDNWTYERTDTCTYKRKEEI